MGKAQHRGGEKTAPRQRHGHREKAVDGGGPQGGGGLQGPFPQGGEGILEGLDHKGQGIEDRAHHQPLEGEGQRMPAHGLQKPPDGPLGAQGDEEVEAQHRGGEDQGKRHQGLYQELEAEAAFGEPPGQGGAEKQEDRGGKPGELQGDPQGRPVRLAHGRR